MLDYDPNHKTNVPPPPATWPQVARVVIFTVICVFLIVWAGVVP